MDFIDEEHVAVFEVGEQRRKIAGLGDDRAGGGPEVDAQFARHDLRQRGLAKARGPCKQHMIQRLRPWPCRLDEHPQILLGFGLADKFIEALRAQMRVDRILGLAFAVNEARVHDSASSFSACRISFSVG